MKILKHEFVKSIPKELEEGILYVSMKYKTVSHLCPCGCKNRVVTPIAPTRWELIFNGKSVSLYPSVGNWSFDCRSHYWIRKNKVKWALNWTDEEIEAARARQAEEQEDYFEDKHEPENDWFDFLKWKKDQDL